MLERIALWIRAARAPFFTATVVPVLLGVAIHVQRGGQVAPGLFLLTLLGALLIHAATDLSNDYFDHLSGADDINTEITPFSAGTRVIQEGLLAPRQILAAALLCWGLAIPIGLYLDYVSPGHVILILGVIGIAASFAYTAPPVKLCYRGWGELAVGMNFGPLMAIGAYYVQAGALDLGVVLASLPVGVIIATVLYINQFPDYVADHAAGKLNLVARLGRERALPWYFVLLAVTYLLIIVEVALRLLPPLALATLLTVPGTLRAARLARRHFAEPQRLIPAMAFTIKLHSLIGAVLVAAFLLDRWL